MENSTKNSKLLPEWDLTDLYEGRDDIQLCKDLELAKELSVSFVKELRGNVEGLKGLELFEAIIRYEKLQDLLGRINSFVELTYSGNLSDSETARFFQNMQEKLNDITSEIIFFRLELMRLSDESFEEMVRNEKSISRYLPWLKKIRAFKPYQLDDNLEKLIHDKVVSGRGTWVRLFDETIANLSFKINGEQFNLEKTLDFLSSSDHDTRKAAADTLGQTFSNNSRLFSLIINTLAKDKEIEDRWRKFQSPDQERHIINDVEAEVVRALRETVVDAYPLLSHRYYRLKAKWFGKDNLDYWDRNAPLPDLVDPCFSFQEARDIVLQAIAKFSPKLEKLAVNFFENNWIDASVRNGKAPGAFSHPTVPSAHPYILLNYLGRSRDVMTLAHELGHGIHQLLASEQGALMADTPLTLAETASVFCEQLAFRSLLERDGSILQRRAMLANKVEDMINTVVRQTAFYEFELKVHNERRNSELSPDRLCQLWMETQASSLGPAIHLDENYKYFWCYIPHFIHSPFYVYAYAFGDCLVNSLFAVYQNEPQQFEEKYIDLLRKGGTLHHGELLAPFGLRAGDPKFWRQGIRIISDFIDELETMS